MTQLFTSWRGWHDAQPEVEARLSAPAAASVASAVAFAAACHGDQRRPTGAPYLEHLLQALEVLLRGAEIITTDVLCAAVLHDTLEDTPCTPAELGAGFGPRVAELVGWVTIPPAAPGQDKAAVKESALRGLRRAPADAVLVKLADRASNVQTLRDLPLARARRYYTQTVTHIVPLAAAHPWFARWYEEWRRDFADLADPV